MDFSSTNTINEIDSEPIPWNCSNKCYHGLEASNFESFFINVGVFQVKLLLVNLGLEEAATVKSNVKKQPRGGTREEINTVAPEELLGE